MAIKAAVAKPGERQLRRRRSFPRGDLSSSPGSRCDRPELKPKHPSRCCEEKKLASINGELDTLRMLGKHDNIVRS